MRRKGQLPRVREGREDLRGVIQLDPPAKSCKMKYSFMLRHADETVFPGRTTTEREAAIGSLTKSRRGGGDHRPALPLNGLSK
jgi:hypothetical protein